MSHRIERDGNGLPVRMVRDPAPWPARVESRELPRSQPAVPGRLEAGAHGGGRPLHPELPFEARKLARTTDPATSHAAAKASKALRSEHHEAILVAMLEMGDQPATACDVAAFLAAKAGVPAALRLDKHQVGRRLGELRDRGYVAVVDEEGRTDTGRPATRYRLVR